MKHILELSDFQFTNSKVEIASQIGQGIIHSSFTEDLLILNFKKICHK